MKIIINYLYSSSEKFPLKGHITLAIHTHTLPKNNNFQLFFHLPDLLAPASLFMQMIFKYSILFNHGLEMDPEIQSHLRWSSLWQLLTISNCCHRKLLLIYQQDFLDPPPDGGAEAVIWRCSVKKSVLRNFAKFIGKLLCQSLFFN